MRRKMETKYIVKDNQVWEKYSDPLFAGFIPVPTVPKGDPWLSFVGPKIPMEEWRKVLGFFKWSYEDTKGETQVRFYFNQKEGLWRAWAFPQEKSYSLHTKEIEELCDEERQKIGMGKGWLLAGTAHHHCNSRAFQSGVDHDNEQNQQGIHITVGDLADPKYSIHGRVTFRNQKYEVCWADWFEFPRGVSMLGVPANLSNPIMEYFLTIGVVEDKDKFPDEWKENVIKKDYSKSTHQTNGPYSYGRDRDYNDPENWFPGGQKKDHSYAGSSPGNKTRYLPSHGKNVGQDKLSKGQRKQLRKLLAKAQPDDVPEDQRDQLEAVAAKEAEKLYNCALCAIQLASVYGIEIDALFELLDKDPKTLSMDEIAAGDDLEDVLKKTGCFPDEVLEYIKDSHKEAETASGVKDK